jgi:hypothetical protein
VIAFSLLFFILSFFFFFFFFFFSSVALEALLPDYCEFPTAIRGFHRLEQGEDRYQNSLCLMSGWRVILVKQSKAETQVPTNLKRLTEQRRYVTDFEYSWFLLTDFFIYCFFFSIVGDGTILLLRILLSS